MIYNKERTVSKCECEQSGMIIERRCNESMQTKVKQAFHPVRLVRITGLLDGTSLLLLLLIAMPLKYWAGIPMAVTIVGSVHGFIVVLYALAILYAQIRVQWNIIWSLLALIVAFIPFGNFVFDRILKRKQDSFPVRPFPKRWLVYSIVLFAFLDLFTQLPVMSTYAISLGASAMLAGLIVGMYSLTNTFGNILAGIFTDRIGAGKILIVGLLMTSLSLLSYNLADNVQLLLIVRTVHGFLGGLIVPAAFTFVANETKREKQGSQSAISGSFVGLAAIIGPAYSGIAASRTSVPFVFTTVAVLGLVLFVLALVFLRGSQTSQHRPAQDRQQREKFVLNKQMVRAYVGAFFLMFSQGALAYLLPQHVESLGFSARLSGTLMSLFGLTAVLVFVLPTNKLFDRVPTSVSLATGIGLMGISQVMIGQTTQPWLLYAILAVYGLGFALLFPSINKLLIHATSEGNRGQAYGIFYALFSAGSVASAFGLGALALPLPTLFLLTGLALLACAVAETIAGGRSHAAKHSSSA